MMNERIKLLAELSKTPKTMMVDGVLQSVVTIDAERFAELIVRECVEQLEIGKRCDPYTGELFSCKRNDDIDYDITNLKEHFGVKE